MKDVRDNAFSFLDDWYGRLDDIIEDLKEHGFDVLNATAEWIDVSDADDKEYVIKLDGTKRTITIKSIEALNESVNSEKELCDKVIKQYLDGDNMSKIAADLNITRADVKVCVDEYMTNRKKNKSVKKDESLNTLTEGGIYPVALVGGADDAFLKVVNEILGGDISEVDNLELIPSLGFGGSGRYWYKANITIDDDTIINNITEENTPEAYRLMNNETLVINPYSDINVTCSADSDSYHDGVTLDALSGSDANMENLDKESNIIGSAIIAKLFEAEDKIIEVLKQYEDEEVDEYEESLIPIQEYWDEDEWDDDELANIYGGDTAQSQKDIAEDEIAASKLEAFDDWKEPKLGKKIKQLKGWKIYQGTDSSGDEVFRCFTPDEYRPEVGYEDWECETLEQAISWIQNYDLEESTKTNKENIKDDSKKVLEDDSSEENDELIVVEYITSGDNEVDVQRRLTKIKNAIDYYENNDDDTLYNLIDKLEDELEDLKDINMKKISTVNKNKDTLTEQDTFGNYEENVFTALDNIEVLASSYEEFNADGLKTLISRLEDELDTLKKINMKLITGIKQYTL